ncbi:xanthine dehydrogenase accessory factor [Micromonospora phaseoli]|uniref:Xanthine dehydrogenase accessory factor n=1 Tax=Micromonospora phaseoli TaxID=1144548 RepID=A0A1H6V1G1_9ACTN|nr:XdhC family protein [Micromonospora phaseoli]PZV93754.1 xanthine dehydrogenase accessory factor [Micromonospora phaseoli]GIJ79970.1 xanthine dehydrogenase accessory factor [Micromonospora phaseoli]SEI98388.1 xanthine dehydrogenase accessory factor [Micromonospora phaseoli]
MREIVDGLRAWRAAGVSFAVATVVRTWRSAPRQPGATMAVSADGEVLGSVSGGCVEGAVYELCLDSIATGKARTEIYGVSDDDAFGVGLTCGGTVEILVQPDCGLTEFDEVLAAIAGRQPVATASAGDGQLVVWPDRVAGSLGDPDLDRAAARQAAGMLALGSTGTIHLGTHGQQRLDEVSVFVQSYVPPPRMIVFGAIDYAAAVARIGRFLGHHVTVCDARPVFATRKRFPDVDELVVQWPHRYLESTAVDERTVLCVLTHDPKFDVPLLEVALRTPARYIGAMGSRRTHSDRLRRLREAGVDEAALSRLRSPIGLDLGARTPEETAVAIAAEIISTAWDGSGRPLTHLNSPIHRP